MLFTVLLHLSTALQFWSLPCISHPCHCNSHHCLSLSSLGDSVQSVSFAYPINAMLCRGCSFLSFSIPLHSNSIPSHSDSSPSHLGSAHICSIPPHFSANRRCSVPLPFTAFLFVPTALQINVLLRLGISFRFVSWLFRCRATLRITKLIHFHSLQGFAVAALRASKRCRSVS